MSSTIRNAKQSVSIQDTAAERWSRLYVDVRARLCNLQRSLRVLGIGVMLAACSSVVALLIQNVAIAHPKDAEGRTGRRLRLVGISEWSSRRFFFSQLESPWRRTQ